MIPEDQPARRQPRVDTLGSPESNPPGAPVPDPQPDTIKAILEPERSSANDTTVTTPNADPPLPTLPAAAAALGRTTDDLPVFELTDAELEREYPEFVRARKLNDMLGATYGTGVANGTSESGGPAGFPASDVTPGVSDATDRQSRDPHPNTIEAIFGRSPPPDPSPPGAVRAPPGIV
jgi:hypothetical protein